MSKKIRHFTIKNINIDNIHKKYGIKDNINNELSIIGEQTTNITYFDQSKNTHICKINSVDINYKKYLNCYWDTFPIGNDKLPIGCPIGFIPSVGIKDYISSISKNRYIIREYLTPFISKNVEILEKNDFYITDKCFCSFNCALSFINKNKLNPLYKFSKILLYKMFNEVYGTEFEIIPAGDIDLLIEYGGMISIDKFREGFNTVEYVNQGILQTRPIVRIFEEKFKL